MRALLVLAAITAFAASAEAKEAKIEDYTGLDRVALNPIRLPEEPTFQPGPRVVRSPYLITGKIVMTGHEYEFGSGGLGYGSIPYGDFPVTPKEVGSWGKRHDAIGINHNTIVDPKYKPGTREGIEIHSQSGRRTYGCVGVETTQWGSFKRDLFAMIDAFGGAWLHIRPEGAAITASREPPPLAQLIALNVRDNVQVATVRPRFIHYRHYSIHYRHYASARHHRHWGHKHYASR
jgi:hypothetical protein